jgi:hypothetical protein
MYLDLFAAAGPKHGYAITHGDPRGWKGKSRGGRGSTVSRSAPAAGARLRVGGAEGWLFFAAVVTLVLLAVASASSRRLRYVALLSLCVPVGVLWLLGWSWAYDTVQSEYGYPLIYSRGQAQAELALLTRQQTEFSAALERARRAFALSSKGEPYPQGSDLVSQAEVHRRPAHRN